MSDSPFDEPNLVAPERVESAPEPAARGVLLPPVVPDELPRLRIHHIMLLMAVTAVALSSVQLYAKLSAGGGPMPTNPVVGGVLMVGAILVSLALTVTLLGWWWGRGRRIAFDQPGQRLAMDVVGRTVAIVAVVVLAALLERVIVPSTGVMVFMLVGIYGPGLAIVILELYLARSQPPRSVWRFVFYAKALFTVGFGIATLLPMFGAYGIRVSTMGFLSVAVLYVLVVVLQFSGIIRDRRQHIARHWTHWWGLASHLGINLAMVSAVVFAMLSNFFVPVY